MKPTKPICVAITGASGAAYGLRLIECLLHVGHPVYLLVTTPGQIVIAMETELKFPGRPADIERFLNTHYGVDEGQLRVFGKDEWTAPMASGSGAPEAMVVCPCTMGTLSAIACGSSRNLMERSADVMLKERKKTGVGGKRDAVIRHSFGKHAALNACRGGDFARQPRLLSQPNRYQ